MSDRLMSDEGNRLIDNLFEHRAVLFSVLTNTFKEISWKAKLPCDGNMFVVGIATPSGQVAFHCKMNPYWTWFDCKELTNVPVLDNVTTEEFVSRLASLRDALKASSAHWKEVPALWRTRKKYECSNCGAYVTGRFTNTPVKSIHKICHSCGAAMTEETVELPRDENGFYRSQ